MEDGATHQVYDDSQMAVARLSPTPGRRKLTALTAK
jgi:hypothetical protein